MTAPCFTITGLSFKMKICSCALNSFFVHCCSEVNSRIPKQPSPTVTQLELFPKKVMCFFVFHLLPALPSVHLTPCSSPHLSQLVTTAHVFRPALGWISWRILRLPPGVVLACPCLSLPGSLIASSAEILLIVFLVLLGVNTFVSTTRLYVFFF